MRIHSTLMIAGLAALLSAGPARAVLPGDSSSATPDNDWRSDSQKWSDNCASEPVEGCSEFIGPLRPGFCDENPSAPACGSSSGESGALNPDDKGDGLMSLNELQQSAPDWKPVEGGPPGALCSESMQMCTKVSADIASAYLGSGAFNAQEEAATKQADDATNDYCSGMQPGESRPPCKRVEEQGKDDPNPLTTASLDPDNSNFSPDVPAADKDFSKMNPDEQKEAIQKSDESIKKQADAEKEREQTASSGGKTYPEHMDFSVASKDPRDSADDGSFTPDNPSGGSGAPEVSDTEVKTCADFAAGGQMTEAECYAMKAQQKEALERAMASGAALEALNAEQDPNAMNVSQTGENMKRMAGQDSTAIGRARNVLGKLLSGMNLWSGDDQTLANPEDKTVSSWSSGFDNNRDDRPQIPVEEEKDGRGIFGISTVKPTK